MNRGSALLSVMALFLSGVAIGALGLQLYHSQQTGPGQFAREFRHTAPGEMPPMPLWQELDLTPQQQENIHEILEESRRRGHELRERLRPQVMQQIEEAQEQIRQVLTAEQRDKLDAFRMEHGRMFERMFLGRGGSRGFGRGRPGSGRRRSAESPPRPGSN